MHRGAPAWLWRAPPGHRQPPGRPLTDELSPGLLPGRRPARWDSAGEYLLEAGCARGSDSTDTVCVSVFSSLWGFQGSREAVTGEGRCLIRSLQPWIVIEPSSGGWVGEQRGELEGRRRVEGHCLQVTGTRGILQLAFRALGSRARGTKGTLLHLEKCQAWPMRGKLMTALYAAGTTDGVTDEKNRCLRTAALPGQPIPMNIHVAHQDPHYKRGMTSGR